MDSSCTHTWLYCISSCSATAAAASSNAQACPSQRHKVTTGMHPNQLREDKQQWRTTKNQETTRLKWCLPHGSRWRGWAGVAKSQNTEPEPATGRFMCYKWKCFLNLMNHESDSFKNMGALVGFLLAAGSAVFNGSFAACAKLPSVQRAGTEPVIFNL